MARLAVDFGTTTTVGALARNGQPTVIELRAPDQTTTSRIPSAVWLDDDGDIAIGTDALQQAAFAPERFEATPKRTIGEGELLLGDELVAHSRVIAAFIAHIAMAVHSAEPLELVLTHPADWGDVRIGVLREAASSAGFQDPTLVPEPVAAAVGMGGEPVRAGRHDAIYDFGGGTFDAAILRQTKTGYEVVGRPRGRDPLGGADIDQRILDYLGRSALAQSPRWGSLMNPTDDSGRRGLALWREELRKAKESLSVKTAASLWVPVVETKWQLTRSELDELIKQDVEATLDILAAAIADAGCTVKDVDGIFLVGGSSRIPLVADAVWRRFGQQPKVDGDPKAVVALGAAVWQQNGADPPSLARGARFRGRLAMARQTPFWSESSECYGQITLSGDDLIVQLADVPAGNAELADRARAAGELWQRVPGYREQSLTRASVLGQIDGLERTLIADHLGTGVRWMERYLIYGRRALTVTANESARNVADALRIGRPLLEPRRHYEPSFLAEVPAGWKVTELVELERSGSHHRLRAMGVDIGQGSRVAWAQAQAQKLAESLGAPMGSPRGAKLLGHADGIQYTFTGADGRVTRAWYLVDGGRGYEFRTTLAKLEAFTGLKLMLSHAVLARRRQAHASLAGSGVD